MEMKIRESCLQTGTFIYKPGILVTKQDFHLQSGSLVLQMGFSGYYLPTTYLFNTEEEKYMAEIIKSVQDHDVEIRKNIKENV